MRILVQKFGGTSVAGEKGRQGLARKVREARVRGMHPVVVISAMGRAPQPYATDTLLGLVAAWRECQEPRELDMLMACGEILSSVVVSHFLRSLGLPARAFSGAEAGILTEGPFGEARVASVDPGPLRAALEAGEIPVVAGFQGACSGLGVATLGRGGSDTTAVALGAGLGAEAVEIYTDVEGVMTADPRQVPEARVLPDITLLEMGEMANEGSRVLHPRAVAMAEAHRVPLVVRSTFSEAPGTRILDRPVGVGELVTGIVTVGGLCRVCIDLGAAEDLAAERSRVFESLAGAGLSLDLINVLARRLYVLLKEEDLRSGADDLLQNLGHPGEVRRHCAKVSVVGQGMRGVPGVMFRIHRALQSGGVELIHSTDSHITISCVVPEDHLARAARALHREFGLHQAEGGAT